MEENYEEKVMTKEEWKRRFDAVKALGKGTLNEPQRIDCLNLVMKKEFALDIINGVKHVEFRSATDFYHGRLMEKSVLDMLVKHGNDNDVIEACDGFEVNEVLDPVRIVNKIHFHNYNNTWSLDVEVLDNNLDKLSLELDEFVKEEYGYDDILDTINSQDDYSVENPPMVYYFVLGQVLERVNI